MRPAGHASKLDAELQPEARPWIALNSPQEIEAWADRLNHELQQIEHDRSATAADRDRGRGQGVCLMLTNGGEIVLHTAADGHILLDVDNDATWVAPLIVAATGAQMPRGAIWVIPGERLIELITGLNSLIGSERLVLRHKFHLRS